MRAGASARRRGDHQPAPEICARYPSSAAPNSAHCGGRQARPMPWSSTMQGSSPVLSAQPPWRLRLVVGVADRVAQGSCAYAVEMPGHLRNFGTARPRSQELASDTSAVLPASPGERAQRRRKRVGLRLQGQSPKRDVMSLRHASVSASEALGFCGGYRSASLRIAAASATQHAPWFCTPPVVQVAPQPPASSRRWRPSRA